MSALADSNKVFNSLWDNISIETKYNLADVLSHDIDIKEDFVGNCSKRGCVDLAHVDCWKVVRRADPFRYFVKKASIG